jgi:1-acyl-sn-glycerol-3-phosphate acyltransferase
VAEFAWTLVKWCVLWISRMTLAIGRLLYGLEVHGLEYFPTKGPSMLIARHSSRADIFVGSLARYMAMKSPVKVYGATPVAILLNNRLLARLIREIGGLPAFKGKGLSSPTLIELYNLLRQGNIVGVVPEGEIAWDGRLQPLKPGVAWLALRTGAPIVCVVLRGGYDIWPRWARWPRLTGKLIIQIGEPFHICSTPCERVNKAMIATANQRIKAELERLSEGYLLQPEKAP